VRWFCRSMPFGTIWNCESDPGKLGSLSVSSYSIYSVYSTYSMRTIHYVPLGLPHARRRARTVSGCLNSAFLNISQHFTSHLFRPWIRSSTRRQHFASSLGPFPAAGTPRFSDLNETAPRWERRKPPSSQVDLSNSRHPHHILRFLELTAPRW